MIGPIFSDLNPPTNYTLVFSGKGGTVGDATGTAVVELAEETEGNTTIEYSVQADVSGKIAQVGGRLISSTAKLLTKKFFKKFTELVESGPDTEASTDAG